MNKRLDNIESAQSSADNGMFAGPNIEREDYEPFNVRARMRLESLGDENEMRKSIFAPERHNWEHKHNNGDMQNVREQERPRVPSTKDYKLATRSFDGKEIYPGLGADFMSWGRKFIRSIAYAEATCGYQWSEDINVEVLSHHAQGVAERYFNKQVNRWWDQTPALWLVLERMNDAFNTTLSTAQAMKYFAARKDPRRTWQ
jgi:hypothetical protein